MTNTINMIDSNAGEVLHLFNVMAKHGVTCSLEFKAAGVTNPLFGITDASVKTDYIKGNDGDLVIVYMDEIEFGFELGSNDFAKYVIDYQILLCISNEHYVTWFNSGVIPSEGIAEANSYDDPCGEFDDKEIR